MSSDGNQIQTIKNYPDGNMIGRHLPKTRSIIAFKSENEANSQGCAKMKRDLIGYEVKSGMKSCSNFKLRLDDRDVVGEHDDALLNSELGRANTMLPDGKSAVDVAAAYLKLLKEIGDNEIINQTSEDTFYHTKQHVIAPIPATWNDDAQRKTRRAFEAAGFGGKNHKLEFIGEPEAAAIGALRQYYDRDSHHLRTGMAFVVLDLGGGTLDGECLEIQSLAPLKLKVIGVGEGAKFGSTAIDRRFLEHMESTYEECFTNIPEVKRAPGSRLMNNFELDKISFSGAADAIYRIEFGALAEQVRKSGRSFNSFQEGDVIVTGRDMIDFFSRTVSKTWALAQCLIEKFKKTDKRYPDGIILVGGLSSSEHLLSQIREKCELRYGNKITILRPGNAWEAIAHGAVEYGLDRTVIVSRVARRNFLIEILRAFEEGVDPEERAVREPIYGKRIAILLPLLKKGERVKQDQTKKINHFGISITDLSEEAMRYSHKIFWSDADEIPQYADDPGVQFFDELKVDLMPVSKRLISKGYINANAKPAEKPIHWDIDLRVSGGGSAEVMTIAATTKNKMTVGELVKNYTE